MSGLFRVDKSMREPEKRLHGTVAINSVSLSRIFPTVS